MKNGLKLIIAAMLVSVMPVLAHADRFDRGSRYDGGRFGSSRFDRPRSSFSFSFGFGSGFRDYTYAGLRYPSYYAPVYVRPAPVIIAPPPVVYYEPAPVIYAPAPVFYQPARVYYSEPFYPAYRPASSFYFSTGYYYGR